MSSKGIAGLRARIFEISGLLLGSLFGRSFGPVMTLCLSLSLLLVPALSGGCAGGGVNDPVTHADAASGARSGAGRDSARPQPEAGFRLEVPSEIWAGEPFLLRMSGAGLAKVTVQWRGKTLPLVPGQGNQAADAVEALLPLELEAKSGSMPLTVHVAWTSGKTETYSDNLTVKNRVRPVQKLRVDPKFVTPPPEMREKIKRDQAELRAAISRISPIKYWTLPLFRPVPGSVTSIFGLRREFNGQPRNPHKGVDFDAKAGDLVGAVEDGVVVLVSEHYYGGNTVVIDHGLGVFSVYLHLSGFRVTPGQSVARGEAIGLVGSTGRSTGPHLHLSMMIQGVSVDAAACIAM